MADEPAKSIAPSPQGQILHLQYSIYLCLEDRCDPFRLSPLSFFVVRGQSVRSLLGSTSSNERPMALPGHCGAPDHRRQLPSTTVAGATPLTRAIGASSMANSRTRWFTAALLASYASIPFFGTTAFALEVRTTEALSPCSRRIDVTSSATQ